MRLKDLTDLYQDDLPSPGSINSELHCWHHKWKSHQNLFGPNDLPKSPAAALKHASALLFPNVRALLTILCVLPVTTCSSERSHSSLKNIKSRLRCTMTNMRLTGLALLHIHRDIDVEPEEIVSEFAKKHPRRLEFLHVMSSASLQTTV